MISTDVIVATADLVVRTGGTEFEMRWDCPHIPFDEGEKEDDHACEEIVWLAQITFRGARLYRSAETPDAAALALAIAILDHGTCRCGQEVTLDDDRPGCRWRLMGKRWEPSCDAPSISVPGKRGDLAAMRTAVDQAHGVVRPNREQRRTEDRNKKRRRRP